MVQVSVNSGSTIETARMLVALIHDVGKECIADITVQECVPDRFTTKDEPSNYHPVHLEIYFHLESENADEHCLKNIGEMRLVTDEFVCGYNGTGPGNLLEVLRAAGITEKMFPDEEIVEKREKPLNVYFSARETIYTGALKEVYDP